MLAISLVCLAVWVVGTSRDRFEGRAVNKFGMDIIAGAGDAMRRGNENI